ncbi:hypothetical protein BU25DRAFT_419381 [Macroventuria anomochaeta]|uniref:Uncharacterized protein n=1 Tax=Macroventuria anomochaeta TaxID=301207 RepID=A0ACB6SAK6_9PLEO|nr:uncharacterized protein BU25DRAFT_419381 [Macroventuria anomochaeta]KAF2630383.1 hypothetical protein BU25DRAFT_419381 [Macroventuria anomochaeta]
MPLAGGSEPWSSAVDLLSFLGYANMSAMQQCHSMRWLDGLLIVVQTQRAGCACQDSLLHQYNNSQGSGLVAAPSMQQRITQRLPQLSGSLEGELQPPEVWIAEGITCYYQVPLSHLEKGLRYVDFPSTSTFASLSYLVHHAFSRIVHVRAKVSMATEAYP